MSDRPRVLFVSEKHPWPQDDGGQIRTFQVLRALARECQVTLLTTQPDDPAARAPFAELGIELVGVAPHRRAWKTPLSLGRALFTRAPHPLPKNFSRAMLREIRARLESGRVDALHLNHLDAAQYLEHLGALRARVRAVIDTHNLLSPLYARLVETARDPATRSYCWLQWTRMCRYEPALLRQAERVLVCSELEREQLLVWGVDRSLVVPNGVDTAGFTPEGPRARPAGAGLELVFTGGMDYLPNSEGMAWFLREIFPRILAAEPAARLCVVGKNPSPALRELGRAGSVEFTGRVEDVRPFARSAQVFVVPLRIGGGTRLKILEALAMQLPLVSTRVGAEGLELAHGEHLLLADTPEEFAAAVLELGRDRQRAESLARRGRERVLERYDWSAVSAPLVRWYRERN